VIIIHRGRIVAIDSPENLGAKLRQSEILNLTVKQTDPDLLEALSKLPGVMHVTHGPSPNTYVLETHIGDDVREELTTLIVTRGTGLLELTTETVSLEDVFKVMTKTNKPVD
jgi:ABC-2 type transport system ATP-binding protein